MLAVVVVVVVLVDVVLVDACVVGCIEPVLMLELFCIIVDMPLVLLDAVAGVVLIVPTVLVLLSFSFGLIVLLDCCSFVLELVLLVPFVFGCARRLFAESSMLDSLDPLTAGCCCCCCCVLVGAAAADELLFVCGCGADFVPAST